MNKYNKTTKFEKSRSFKANKFEKLSTEFNKYSQFFLDQKASISFIPRTSVSHHNDSY